MALQSASCWIHRPKPSIYSNQRLFSHHSVSPAYSVRNKTLELRDRRLASQNDFKSYLMPGLKRRVNESSLLRLNKGVIVYASNSNPEVKLNSHHGKEDTVVRLSNANGVEPFRGKSGSVSFQGLTHQLVEEGKLVSAPFDESSGSFLWVLAPVALICSLVLPQFFIGFAIEGFIRDEILSDIVAPLASEIMFYLGLATFLLVVHHVQKPYLQFSSKRWGLITGLRGYLASAFFTMGFKVVAPLFAVYVIWPILGLPALVSVVPFLLGCLVQFALEKFLDKSDSSCWPLVPIIFEVYRLYQLSRATHFIERLMFAMKEVPVTPEVLERSGALFAMIVTFQILGLVCLWSLLSFLLRLFPSRPVAEKY